MTAERLDQTWGGQAERFAGRYCFVGGLHRSGTSLFARMIAVHGAVGAIEGAPIPEQEGVYLQGAIPHTARHGIPGEFAFDPAQHLVEGCAFDRAETRQRLEADWTQWFPDQVSWRVEKSPVNLLRMRLYQQLFPLSVFVVVVRHPWAVAQATLKWTKATSAELVDHWERAMSLALSDAAFLHHVLVVRYEDLVESPDLEIARVFRFLDLDPSGAAPSGPLRNGNDDYISLPDLPLPETARRLGYGEDFSMMSPLDDGLRVRHPLRAVRDAVLRG